MTASTKVLYVGGTGRTGSTLLDRLLGQVDGVFAGGEIAFLWQMGLHEGGRCSCGEPVASCPVWSAAMAEAFPEGIDPAEMVGLRRRARSVHLPLMVSPRARRWLLTRLGAFPERVERLYAALADVTGSRLLVDSSKEPHYSWILRSRPGLDVRFLHLVRDPRAVAWSWQRRREERGLDDGRFMERRRPSVSAAYHDVSNVAAEALWRGRAGRYVRLRYEDLLEDPAVAFARIAELVDEELDLSGFLHDRVATLHPTHTVWGNPNRFERGEVVLEEDAEWRRSMPRLDRGVVTALTWPVARRYGYRLRP